MTQQGTTASVFEYIVLILVGALSGLLLWLITDNWSNPEFAPLLLLGGFGFVLVYGLLFLLLMGPVSAHRAFWGALVLAIPMTGLILSAGLRPQVATDILDDPAVITIAAVLFAFAAPFLNVWLQDRAHWLNYAALFEAAWALYINLVLAIVFVAVIWLSLFLSNALLTLVDVTFLETLLRRSWMSFAISGGSLGLGLAVLHEFRDSVSPFVILRLLRLLVPVMLGVVVIFLLAAPFQELAPLFGEFSAAGTLIGTAALAVTLVSSALDRSEEYAVKTRSLRLATRLLAFALPFLCALAVWAVGLRVAQYGWTPDRVYAASAGAFVLAYGLAYAGVSIKRSGWTGRIRQANVVMAICVIAMGAAAMTPLLNPYRISVQSQVERFLEGQATLEELPLWEMSHFWGRAGDAGLAQLEALTGRADHTDIVLRISEAREIDSQYQFERAIEIRELPARAGELAGLLTVQGRADSLPPASFAQLDPYQLTRWLEACQRKLTDGRPACVMVPGDFAPDRSGQDQAMILYLDEAGHARGNYVLLSDGVIHSVQPVVDPVHGGWPELPADVIANALDGAFNIRPSGDKALWIGDSVLMRGN
ncbi:MAG: hypothetical protein AB3N13_05430 [Arenibacterium sp.]